MSMIRRSGLVALILLLSACGGDPCARAPEDTAGVAASRAATGQTAAAVAGAKWAQDMLGCNMDEADTEN
jgi:hypothetical protein